MGVGLKELV